MNTLTPEELKRIEKDAEDIYQGPTKLNGKDRLVGGIPRAEHATIHARLRKKHGSAKRCDNPIGCACIKPKRFEWALKKGCKYSDNPKDYIQLCASCHRKYDDTQERRFKISKSNKGHLAHNPQAVRRIDPATGVVVSFFTIKSAANITGASRTAIQNALSGISKTSGGFVWEYDNKKAQ